MESDRYKSGSDEDGLVCSNDKYTVVVVVVVVS